MRRSVSFPQGTMVTYITWDFQFWELELRRRTLCEQNFPCHHIDKSLPSVEPHKLGRKNWKAWSGLKVKAVEPDKGQRGGPSRSVTNIVHRYTRWEGLGGRHTSGRMSPHPQRWGEIRWLISSGNSINYPSTEDLLVSRKTLLIRTVAHKMLVWFPPQGSSVDVCRLTKAEEGHPYEKSWLHHCLPRPPKTAHSNMPPHVYVTMCKYLCNAAKMFTQRKKAWFQ